MTAQATAEAPRHTPGARRKGREADARVVLHLSDAAFRRFRDRAERQDVTVAALVDRLISMLTANWPDSATRPEESESERRRRDRHFRRVCEEIGRAHPEFSASDNLPREAVHERVPRCREPEPR